ncbi:MAG TPA: cytochrome C oxidase subunit IV family protein [Chthoniobacterales bacterium]|jgi:cytochrome c oxidase subunit 4|nr:cytochrome C oxidase subunit IV family protein [Chthoniobacterales bacterium]
MTHSPKVYWLNCLALMALLTATWCIGYINLGVFNLVVALAIGVTKMLLIVLFFMHIKGSSRILHLVAGVGLIWLLLMFSLTLGDYLSRGWVSTPK